MKFGTWSPDKIQEILSKINHYYNEYKKLQKTCTELNDIIYERYLEINENKKTFFRLVKVRVLTKEEFFNRTWAYSVDHIYIFRNNNYLKKYDIKHEDFELEVYGTLEEIIYKVSSDIKKLKERLSYCTGGDITADEIYLLCDIENFTKKIETALHKYHQHKV